MSLLAHGNRHSRSFPKHPLSTGGVRAEQKISTKALDKGNSPFNNQPVIANRLQKQFS
jgi:hypothetical protein